MAQTNLQKKELATYELMIEASKRKIAIALLQELYVGGTKAMKAYRGAKIFQYTGQGEGTVKAALAVFDHNMDVMKQSPT